jgi:hypothetical protein
MHCINRENFVFNVRLRFEPNVLPSKGFDSDIVHELEFSPFTHKR